MIRRMLLALAILIILSAATPAGAVKSTRPPTAPPNLDSAATFTRPDAKELLREAQDLWHLKEDYTGALAKFNDAVDAAPDDNDIRLQRARFFERLVAIVVPDDKAEFKARAEADFEHIAASDPDSLIAGIARDGLTRLSGELLIEVERVACPESAAKARALANSLYNARRYAEAAAEYEKATTGCPDNAAAWVDFADSYYELEDYGRAKELFVRALSIDPWNRSAHRYLSDTEIQLKNLERAAHHMVLAVVSDPTYEAGWSTLRAYAAAMDWKWNRVYGDRKGGPGNADGASWAAYEAAKANARTAHPGPASALAIERAAVKTALSTSKEPGPFWSMMAQAERADFLDEAIFIHMLDADLAAEYPAFREVNAERLATYLATVILPGAPPPGPKAEASGS